MVLELFKYLEQQNPFKNYIGWDINPNLIADTKSISDKAIFNTFDIALDIPDTPVANIGCMLGLLNWNLMDIQKNYDYSVRLISNAFESVTDILVVDFLSSYTSPDYPVEDSVFYHDPLILLVF